MIEHSQRLTTSIPGFDTIVRGGLFRRSVCLVTGQPGAGKTIFGNQVAFAHARGGGKTVYCTLLAETHGRMIANLSTLSFFDERYVGSEITYLEGFGVLDKDGLEGAMKLLRGAVREQQATLLIIDGTVTAERMSPSDLAFKRFIQELKSWVELIDCTAVLLTSSGANVDEVVKPEHTMVDMLIQLTGRQVGMRVVRELCVRKLRGSGFLEGFHSYTITGDGLVVWPRLEAALPEAPAADEARDEIVPLGVAGIDEMIDGGVRRDSVTLVVGATGVGKTMLGLQFLREGAARDEECVYFGLFEDPSLLRKIAARIGLSDGDGSHLAVVWQPDTERLLDALGSDVLKSVDAHKARRLVIDGMVAFKTAANDIERLPGFFAALTNELRRRGVTTLFTEELREVAGGPLHVPVENIAANCDNILFLRQLEREGRLERLISVVKTRGAGHDSRPRPFDVTAQGIVVGGGRSGARATSGRGGPKPRKRRR
ncbi:MAG: RecA bacterial recombination family protein [bacterium]|nr:RecA bacterial recombination family protein [bacterium]